MTNLLSLSYELKNIYIIPKYNGQYKNTFPIELHGKCTQDEYNSYIHKINTCINMNRRGWNNRSTWIFLILWIISIPISILCQTVLLFFFGHIVILSGSYIDHLYYLSKMDAQIYFTLDLINKDISSKSFEFRYIRDFHSEISEYLNISREGPGVYIQFV